MVSGSECPSLLALDEWLVGELWVARRLEVTQHVDSCARCEERLRQLQVERKTFVDRAPAFGEIRAAAFSSARARADWSLARWYAPLAAGLAVAAAMALWLRVSDPEAETPQRTSSESSAPPGSRAGDTTRLKGRPFTMSFHVKRGTEVSRGEAGMTLHPGDGLRFAFSLPAPGHCGVWGIDAQGVVSPYFSGGELVALPAGSEQPLPGAVALDATTGRERLVGVVCERPMQTDVVTTAFSVNPVALQLPDGCAAEVLVVSKQP